MLEALNDYDWGEAFGYAGEPGRHGSAVITAVEGCSTDCAPFTREDVKKIIASSVGENDGASWIIVVRLKDGRFAFLSAGCDYTGWDCRASGCVVVADTLKRLVKFGLGDDDRARLGLDRKAAL